MYNLLIMFYDDKSLIVHDVKNHGYIKEVGMFYFDKNEIRSFVPESRILYFGVAYENTELKKEIKF